MKARTPHAQKVETFSKRAWGVFVFGFLLFTIFPASFVFASDLNQNGLEDSTEPEVIVSTNQTLDAGEYIFQNLVVTNNATLKLKGDPQSSLAFKGVKIIADSITVESGAYISADGEGYGSDGPGYTPSSTAEATASSYGGVGGGNHSNSFYGSSFLPNDLGSGMDTNNRGGGAIWLDATTLTNHGRIVTNGNFKSSGGSILVETNTLSGSGIIEADGGGSFWPHGGQTGGGGRIAIYYDASTYTGVLNARAGVYCDSGCSMGGGLGTIALIDRTQNTLYIEDFFRFEQGDAINFNTIYLTEGSRAEVSSVTIDVDTLVMQHLSKFNLLGTPTLNIVNIYMYGNALMYLSGSETLNIDSLELLDYATISISENLKTLNLDIRKIYVEENASIIANAKGYGLEQGLGAPTSAFAGASYGGVGSGNSPSTIYGNEREPTDFGSGGSFSAFFPTGGGGAIRINTDEIALDGLISANGGQTSSGGSVYITTKLLTGGGRAEANGGNYYCPGITCYRAGGGGRIAVYYEETYFTGTLDAKGGLFCSSGCYPDGGNGTVVYEQVETACTPGVEEGCNSNVLFLPGMMGSRLYEYVECGGVITGDCGEHELWISNSSLYHERLSLNTAGKSIRDVYTKNDTQKLNGEEDETGIIDDVDINLFISPNIYKSFINDLKKWKDDEDLIEDYAFIPYDWRLSLEDIITNAKVTGDNLVYKDSYPSQDFSESFILQKLEELQASSRTEKVTIVAHSNGGLVAKALIQKLKDTNNPLYEKIDKVILVAVPQIGTPEALVSLLHGVDITGGFVMSAERSRQISENMPVIYNLLPSASYFTTVEPQYATGKLVSFENVPFFEPQTNEYGVFVSNATELKDYVLGTDGRIKPAYEDTVHPNIGNHELYLQAEATHQILDSWTPHPDTKVIQVAGWGEETIAGIDYKEIVTTECPLQNAPCVYGSKLSFTKRTVVDGDKTVIVPSALWMSDTNPNVERWLVNLIQYFNLNDDKKEHKDILEISNLREFVKSKIKNTNYSDTQSIVIPNNINLVANSTRLHYTLHSPLTLGITDSEGHYTGMDPVTKEIRNEIPDITYEQIGEVQFLSVPAGIAYTLVMHGYENGSFALDVEKQIGNDVVATTSFQGIPSGVDTIARMEIPIDFDVNASELKIDNDGDAVVDKTLDATPDGITIYDTTPPAISMSFNFNINEVEFKGVDENPVVVTHSNTHTKATDNQGNTSTLYYTKYKEKPTRLKLTFNTIDRNNTTTTFPNTHVTYDWDTKDGDLIDLDTRVVIKGVEKYIFNYKKKQNITVIKVKTGDTVTTTTRTGFVGVTIKTNNDEVLVNY